MRRLLCEQHPDLAQQPLRAVNSGWDNAIFRLGDSLAVRLPRREIGARLIANEQEWLPRLSARWTLPVPVPLRTGTPTAGYPWSWSVVPWLPGTEADLAIPEPSQASRLAEFLCRLHTPAPAGAPLSRFRGIPLRDRRDSVDLRLKRLRARSYEVNPKLLQLWDEAVSAPIDIAATWLHGDLHPRNILVDSGRISGIIDWGDITVGDPATDLASLWLTFSDPRDVEAGLAGYGNLSDATVLRAIGWVIVFASLLLDAGLVNDPRHAAIGERALRRVAAFRS